jgi:hypothetical protein
MSKITFPSVGATYRGFMSELRTHLLDVADFMDLRPASKTEVGSQIGALLAYADIQTDLPAGDAPISDTDTVDLYTSAGVDTTSEVVATVVDSVLTKVTLPATVAPVKSTDPINVFRSAGTDSGADALATVAAGVVTKVTMPATHAIVASGVLAVVPSGTYVSTVTITVAAGAITAIVLS